MEGLKQWNVADAKQPIRETVEAEHFSIAEQMAANIMDRFDPIQQNEVLERIKTVIAKTRAEHIAKAEMHFEFLKQTYTYFEQN